MIKYYSLQSHFHADSTMSKDNTDINDWMETTELPRRVQAATLWTVAVSGLWLSLATSLGFLVQAPLEPLLGLRTLLSPSASTLYILVLAAISVWASVSHATSYSVTPAKPQKVSSLLYHSLHPQILLSLVMSAAQALVTAWAFLRIAWPQAGEDERFLVGCGLVTGVHLGWEYCLLSGNTLTFPIIHKERSSQVWEVVSWGLVSRCLVRSLVVVQYYLAASLVTSLATARSLPCSASPATLLAALLVSLVVVLGHRTRLALFSVHLTAPLPELPPCQLLSLLSSRVPLVRTLGLQSVARQLVTSPATRGHVFALSQPGGHPTNWVLVRKVCLDNISGVVPGPSPAPAPPPPQTVTTAAASTAAIRRLGGPSTGAKLQDITLTEAPAPQLLSLSAALQKLRNLGVTTDVSVDVLSVISSVDIISELVCCSLAEDKFGVVQRDLADIITALCKLDTELGNKQLQQKLPKGPVLKQCVKAGLYKIALKFGPHLSDISMSSGVAQKMRNYSDLLEA